MAVADASNLVGASVAASAGLLGLKFCIAVRPFWREARQARKALHQRISLTHVEARYFYNLERPWGTGCVRVPPSRTLVDFGRVNERDGYSSLYALTEVARNSKR